ncbi:Octicosapeptide/Phox/Bem1p family protein [Forsythia ovata]|uniref:Octicosapeptide/Phox/Bem1p family protein n=1 Tax=Forsythia ovata TaxID=205694 RepID=A0ABD1R8A6_9LAMI
MASLHPVTELDSGTADSVSSTPRSEHHHLHDDFSAVQQPRVRFMCSFGGKILPRPHDNQLRYVGGDTRIVAVHRHITFSSLLSKLSKLSGTTNISIKYQLPSEDLDSLITVTTDEDIENMMEENDRLSQNHKTTRLRVFLFSTDAISRASSISSLLDGSAKRQNWFFDALNGGSGPVLERGRSEVSSIVSEVPDYLFGLDNSDDAIRESKLRNKNHLNDNVSFSDPGSPAPVVSSPFCSTSSSLAPPGTPGIPDLPPVKTRPVNPNPISAAEPKESHAVDGLAPEVVNEKMGPPQSGYAGAPMWHYPSPTMQHIPSVYYVPGPVQPGNNPFPPAPFRTHQYIQQIPLAPGQVPVGYAQSQPVPGVNQVYGTAGVMSYEMPTRVMPENANQTVYYGTRNAASAIPGSYPGMVVSGGEEMQGSGPEGMAGRVTHGS